jgi:hypothetical protein
VTEAARRESAPPPARWRASFLLAATALVAALGPALVVRDRWLGWRRQDLYLSAWGTRFPFLRDFNLPTYAAVLAAALLVLVVLAAWSRHPETWRAARAFAVSPRRPSAGRIQRRIGVVVALLGGCAAALLFLRGIGRGDIPGPDLALALVAMSVGAMLSEVSVRVLALLARKRFSAAASIVAAHAALLAYLSSHFAGGRLAPLLLVLALLAAANLAARVGKTGLVPVVILAFAALYAFQINHWRFAQVGDEYNYWDHALRAAVEHDRAYVASHLFQMEGGVEGAIPYAASLIQAAGMKVLGLNSFGWRFGTLYLCALSLAFFHRFFRTFLTRRAAVTATVLLGASHYVMSFGKIGYIILQALVAMGLVLAAAAWAVRTRRMAAFVCLGLAAGFCFYVYPAALYVLPLPALLVLLYAFPRDRATLARWAAAVFVTAMTVFPLPLQPTYFASKRAGTVLYNPELIRSTSVLAAHFARNFAYAAFSPWIAPSETHFVTASYVDPLSGMLLGVGLAACLWLARRDRFAVFLLLGLACLLFFAGASHDREYPPTTRMFLLLPLVVIFAAAGLERLLGLARMAGVSPSLERGLLAAALLSAVALNVYQAHVVSRRRSTGYELFDPLLLRVAFRLQALAPASDLGIVVVTTPGASAGGVTRMLRAYSLPAGPEHFRDVEVEGSAFSDEDRKWIADPRALVAVSPILPTDLQDALEHEIAGLGKTPCAMRTSNGEVRFRLWAASGSPRLCDE